MNSVSLANAVNKEIKTYSIVPTPELLYSIVERIGNGEPKLIIDNAYGRVMKRLADMRKALAQYQKTESQEDLEILHNVMLKPIKEGSY